MKKDQGGALQQLRHNALLALPASMKRMPTRTASLQASRGGGEDRLTFPSRTTMKRDQGGALQ